MSKYASATRTSRRASDSAERAASTRAKGATFAPPAYGIDFVDSGMLSVQARAESPPNRTGMPDRLKAGIESLSGMDMSDVRVRFNSDKPARLDALAYAQGNDIHLASGQEKHLPHEAWHVVQQRQGRVQPTLQAKGAGINDDATLEREADVMGDRALRTVPAHSAGCACPGCCPPRLPAQLKRATGSSEVVQRSVSVGIRDANGVTRAGESGHEDSTRGNFSHWPALRTEFERVVQPHPMPELDDDGQPTGGTYTRNRYMCAEPNALGALLHHYDHAGHGLTAGFLAGLQFPALAIDSKTNGSIAPCPVCSQWVTNVAPMAVQNLAAVPMKNQKEIDAEEQLRLQEQKKKEQAEDELKQKSLRKEAKSQASAADVQKAETIKTLQAKRAPAALYELLSAHIGDVIRQTKGYDRKKKPSDAKNEKIIKPVTDRALAGWINSLSTTNVGIIKLYERFDDGHQQELVTWVSKNWQDFVSLD